MNSTTKVSGSPPVRVGLTMPNPKGKDPDFHGRTSTLFLTTLYVIVNDFCQFSTDCKDNTPYDMYPRVPARSPPSPSSPDGHASAAETSTATPKPSCAIPSPPCPSASVQPPRAPHVGLIEDIGLHLAEMMEPQRRPYQALDSSAMPVRDAKRRGEDGWPGAKHSMVQQPGMVRRFPSARGR